MIKDEAFKMWLDASGVAYREDVAWAAWKAAKESIRKELEAAKQKVPDGWQLVPVNPTGKMCDSGVMEEGVLNPWGTAIRIYTAMLVAAPQPPRSK
jgi:hypothetical protein